MLNTGEIPGAVFHVGQAASPGIVGQPDPVVGDPQPKEPVAGLQVDGDPGGACVPGRVGQGFPRHRDHVLDGLFGGLVVDRPGEADGRGETQQFGGVPGFPHQERGVKHKAGGRGGMAAFLLSGPVLGTTYRTAGGPAVRLTVTGSSRSQRSSPSVTRITATWIEDLRLG